MAPGTMTAGGRQRAGGWTTGIVSQLVSANRCHCTLH